MGKTQIAFMDIENMSGTSQLVVVLVVLGAFAALLKFFYSELVDKEPDVNDVRKEMLKMRKEKKA